MKRLVLTLMAAALSASSAMAATFPTLAKNPNNDYVTLNQTNVNNISLSALFGPSQAQGIAAYGVPTAGTYSDYVLSTTLHFDQTNPTESGLMARMDQSQRFYWASVNPYNGYLALDYLDGVTGDRGYLSIGDAQIPGFSNAKDYKLVFNVAGTSLTAAVYDGTTQVAAVSGNNSGLASGAIGLFEVAGGGKAPTSLFSNTFVNSTVNNVLIGDTNLDYKVDITDLGNLLANYGATSGKTWLAGDTDGNNNVDITDLGNLLANYGRTVTSTGESFGATIGSPVPEPGTVTIMIAGVLAMLGWAGLRRRK